MLELLVVDSVRIYAGEVFEGTGLEEPQRVGQQRHYVVHDDAARR